MNPEKTIMVVSDLHAPYHDEKAVELVLKVGKEIKPDVLVINGDFVDCYSVSHYDRDPRRKKLFAQEIEQANDLLDYFDRIAKEKIFIAGNHEDRFDRYLFKNAPDLVGVPGLSIKDCLKLQYRGYKYVEYKDYYQIGKVIFTHDLDYANPGIARRAVRDMQHSVCVGHAHRMEYVVEGDGLGKPKIGVCFGWLGHAKHADYKHKLMANRDWAQGFGIGYLLASGNIHFEPVPIVQGHCVVAGKVFKV